MHEKSLLHFDKNAISEHMNGAILPYSVSKLFSIPSPFWQSSSIECPYLTDQKQSLLLPVPFAWCCLSLACGRSTALHYSDLKNQRQALEILKNLTYFKYTV